LKYTFGKGGFLKKEKDVSVYNNSTNNAKLAVYEGRLFVLRTWPSDAWLYICEVNPDTLVSISNWIKIRQYTSDSTTYPGTIVHGKYLYIVGGIDPGSGTSVPSTNISRVDLSGTLSSSSISKSWATLSSGTDNPVLCVHDGYLLVYGGYDYSKNPLTKL